MCRSVLNPCSTPALPFEYCSELLSLFPHLDVADKNNVLEPSVPLMFPDQGKNWHPGQKRFGVWMFQICISTFHCAVWQINCIFVCHLHFVLQAVLRQSRVSPKDTCWKVWWITVFQITQHWHPVRFQREEVWYLFCKDYFLPFLWVVSLASWFSLS